jgi:seryl-tRNA synthetase
LYHELTTKSNSNASEYILAAMNEKDKEMCSLNTKLSAIQNELDKTRQERDDIASKLAEILERRKNLESMKVLVDEGMKQMRSLPMSGKGSGVNEDLLEHTVYHREIL